MATTKNTGGSKTIKPIMTVAPTKSKAAQGTKNTTAIFNPKTKSQNTSANTTVAKGGAKKSVSKGGIMAQSNSTTKQAQRTSAVAGGRGKSMHAAGSSKTGGGLGGKNWSNSQGWGQSNSLSGNKTKFEAGEDVLRLNDADIISDVLASHKGLVKMYGTAMTEIDDQQLRTIIGSQLSECACDQYDAFLYMNQRGLYPTDPAPMPKIKQAKKRFSSLEQTFKM